MPARCEFCDVLSRSEDLVAEEPDAAAFLDSRPLFPGHLLVVPRRHVVTIDELPPELLMPLFGLVQRAVRAVQDVLGAQGAFVANNNVVSQSVPHLHVHVVPRSRGDGLRGFFWPRTGYADAAARGRVLADLRTALSG